MRVATRFQGCALGILSDKVEHLASVGPVLQLIELECVVGCQWPWFGQYGDELLTELLHMSIPPAKLKPTQARGAKRPIDNRLTEIVHDERQDDGPKRKQSRVESKPACEKHCDPTIVNLPISTPASTHPAPGIYSAPVPFLTPATPFPPFYNTTPLAHSQYPPVFPYSSHYFSPTPSFLCQHHLWILPFSFRVL